MGSKQPSQQFDGYFALETLCQVESVQKIILSHIFSRWGGHINTQPVSTFFGKMSKNNVFDVNVKTLYLTREWRPKDEMMIGEEAQVVGTLPRKGNFPFGIFDTKIGFQTWEKKKHKCCSFWDYQINAPHMDKLKITRTREKKTNYGFDWSLLLVPLQKYSFAFK